MAVSSRFAVAVHTLVVLGYLRRQGVDRVTSETIAQSVNTNAVVIRNLIRSLKQAKLVKSKEGKAGGLSLARPPEKITLLAIYNAVEDQGVLAPHLNPEYPHCPVSRSMKKILPTVFKEVDQAVTQTLKDKTLQTLLVQIPRNQTYPNPRTRA